MSDIESLDIETLINGNNPIDWNYWFSLPFWKANEACFLLHLTNPNTIDKVSSEYESFKKISPNGGYVQSRGKLFKLIEIAEREQLVSKSFNNVSPSEWVEWASQKGLEIPRKISEFIVVEKSSDLEKLRPKSESNTNAKNNETKTNRRFRLYAEIEEIKDYKNLSARKIIEQLKINISINGSCIKSITSNNIEWNDWQGEKQITSFKNLGNWLRRNSG